MGERVTVAERWQQWMPFHIDKFRGSPEVQAMHPAARLGYIYLLASAWQSPDCALSADPLDLATASGLGDELWALHGPRILRKFEDVGGRLRNAVLFTEWSDALRVYEKRKSGAVRTNESRSASDERTQPERQADTQTGTLTGTEEEPLASTASAVPAAERGEVLIAFPLNRGEYAVCDDDLTRDRMLYPAVDVMGEYRAMAGWLLSHPKNRKTKGGIRAFIASWLKKAQDRAPTRPTVQAARPQGDEMAKMREQYIADYGREPDYDN